MHYEQNSLGIHFYSSIPPYSAVDIIIEKRFVMVLFLSNSVVG